MTETARQSMLAAYWQVEAKPMLKGYGFGACRQGGAIGIMLAVLLPVILAFLGFGLEIGRLYNRKAEMHALADGIAIAAAKKLDGTSEGVSAALAAAHDVVEGGDNTATKPRYGYRNPMVFSDGAIKFAKAPDGGAGWLDAGSAKASPAGIAYVKVDTNDLNADYGKINLLFMRLFSSATSMQVSHVAVAGRQRLKLLPLAICAMSKDPNHPFAERVSSAEYSELTEYGFRRGVSYNLLKLSPNTASAVNYVVDPVSLPPKSGNFATGIVGPYVCTGTVELPKVIGETLNLQSGFPIVDLVNQLNSRFNVFTGTGKCSPTAAPPDSNTKQFTLGNITWMNTPNGQVAETATSANRMETIADLDPLSDQDPTRYGPLWIYSRPVPWSAYTPGGTEPATGYATFQASKPVWDALYKSGPVLKSYPTDARTGLQSPPYFAPVPEPSSNFPGVPYRRVLNVPLLECLAPGQPGKVVAIGRFLMTAPAISTPLASQGIFAEFGGVTLQEEVSGSVELYR